MVAVGVTVDIKFNKLGRAASRVVPFVEREMREHAEEVRDEARSRARVRTGEMKAGIVVEGGGSDYRVVGTADHTIYNEFGTRYMSAQPMLRPAADLVQPRLLRAFFGLEHEIV